MPSRAASRASGQKVCANGNSAEDDGGAGEHRQHDAAPAAAVDQRPGVPEDEKVDEGGDGQRHADPELVQPDHLVGVERDEVEAQAGAGDEDQHRQHQREDEGAVAQQVADVARCLAVLGAVRGRHVGDQSAAPAATIALSSA